MPTYRITNFDTGPHPDTAIVQAVSQDHAREMLWVHLKWLANEDAPWRETICKLQTDPYRWVINEVSGPIKFVLGAGCR